MSQYPSDNGIMMWGTAYLGMWCATIPIYPPYVHAIDTIRNVNVDILRLVFALFIVFYHVRYDGFVSLFDFPRNGYLAVDFFFIVSGYMVIRSCRENQKNGTERGTLRYCFHKLMSFLPYLIVAELIFGVVQGIVDINPSVKLSRNFELFFGGMWYHLRNILCLSMLNLYDGDIAWYLSALILSTLILYPFVRRSSVIFPRFVAPALGLFLIIVILVVTGQINSPNRTMFGFVSKGLLHGIAEMSLGIFAYECVGWMQRFRFNNDTIVYTVIEAVTLFIAMLFMYIGNPAYPDCREIFEFLIILLIFLGTTVTFSTLSLTSTLVQKAPLLCDNAKWLAVGSLLLYLVHPITIEIMNRWFDGAPFVVRLLIVLVISFGLCALCYVVGNKLKDLMIDELKKSLA